MRFKVVVLLLIIIVFLLYCGVIRRVASQPVKSKRLTFLLTIDDGPNDFTEAIYDCLERRGYLGIFFMTGNGNQNRWKKFHDLNRKIIESGHVIGNHTKHHDLEMLRRATYATIYKEVRFISDYYESEFDYDIVIFRPPFGVRRRFILPKVLSSLNLINMLWTLEITEEKIRLSRGKFRRSKVALAVSIKRQLNGIKEHIVLMHSNKLTADNIEQIANVLERYGTIVTKGSYLSVISDFKYEISSIKGGFLCREKQL